MFLFVHELINVGREDDIVFHGVHSMTYVQLRQRVRQYRNYFYAQGIAQGDNVGLFSRNSPDYICSYMAIVSLGAVVVPMNFQLSIREVEYIIQDAEIRYLVTMERLNLTIVLDDQQEPRQLVLADVMRDVAKHIYADAPTPNTMTQHDACVIIYTSGTTGHPKGAVLTHCNLLSNADAVRQVLPIDASDNVLCVLPMYHCFAWTCAVLHPLLCGASITILDGFSPKEMLVAVACYTVTVIYGVPPMYNILTRIGEAADLRGVRIFVSGGSSLPEQVALAFAEKYNVDILEGYGLSEASPVVAINCPGQVRAASIGRALPNLIVKIVDVYGGAMPNGQIGELIVRGPSVMKSYFKLPKQTAQILKDGWLYTGDLAYQDEDGYLFIVDRLKDMIITSGENIYPREIEELLYAYPGIVEAAVIGVPDTLRGQVAAAYIVIAENAVMDKKLLREYLQVNLAAYKIPRDFTILDALPKNQTGKILKRLLQETV